MTNSSLPYSAAQVTLIYYKGTTRVSLQTDSMNVLGRLPKVGEKSHMSDNRTVPPVTVGGTVKSVLTAYYADVALGITIEVELT